MYSNFSPDWLVSPSKKYHVSYSLFFIAYHISLFYFFHMTYHNLEMPHLFICLFYYLLPLAGTGTSEE